MILAFLERSAQEKIVCEDEGKPGSYAAGFMRKARWWGRVCRVGRSQVCRHWGSRRRWRSSRLAEGCRDGPVFPYGAVTSKRIPLKMWRASSDAARVGMNTFRHGSVGAIR